MNVKQSVLSVKAPSIHLICVASCNCLSELNGAVNLSVNILLAKSIYSGVKAILNGQNSLAS